MKRSSKGERLIRLLLADPSAFSQAGTGMELLQAYFDGFPVETLRPLLATADPAVRREAVWVASELGKEARPLIREAVALTHDSERYVRSYALDIIAVCAVACDLDRYIHVVRALEDADEVIRVQAMFLMSNSEASQLEAAALALGSGGPSDELHNRGLSQLLFDRLDAGQISCMIDSTEPLLRKYGAIAAWRRRDRFPELVWHLASNADEEIKKFWEQRAGRRGAKR